jgi:hypothetical protein
MRPYRRDIYLWASVDTSEELEPRSLGSAFSMSRSLVSRLVLRFFLHRDFAFIVVHSFVALHRVSIRTLDELSWCRLGAG